MPAINSPVANEHSANDRLREQAVAVSKDIQGIGAAALDAAQEKFGQMEENAAELYDQGRDKVRQVARKVEKHIVEQPLTSVVVAAVVGLLLGRFWMRR
jgi:ElaB/YqjD/DUF883 family membrane-anchored ribosome-binding protein